MSAAVVQADAAGVTATAQVVRAGGVVLYPTETVYGLGCDPWAAEAVGRIRALKGRDADKPMLALTDEWARVEGWLGGLTAAHRKLMAHAGPLTVLFEATAEAPPALVGPDGLVGIRRTADPFCRAVVAEAGVPLVSTSANAAGGPAPARFADVEAAIRAGVDAAVDAGAPLAGQPSTVVRVVDGRLVVLRAGAAEVEGEG